jgi:hypothetical protein
MSDTPDDDIHALLPYVTGARVHEAHDGKTAVVEFVHEHHPTLRVAIHWSGLVDVVKALLAAENNLAQRRGPAWTPQAANELGKSDDVGASPRAIAPVQGWGGDAGWSGRKGPKQ